MLRRGFSMLGMIPVALACVIGTGLTIGTRTTHAGSAASQQTPAPVLANPNPAQGSCPQGFYFYENSTYSVCYPNILIPYLDSSVVNPVNGSIEQDVVDLPDTVGQAHIVIIPSFAVGGPNDECVTQVETSVSGYPATRVTHRASLANSCGNISELDTIVQIGNSHSFWMMYQAYVGGTLSYLNEYATMEQTLSIK